MRFADHWGLVLTYGLVTLGLGVVLAVWPGETLRVCGVIIAIQLILTAVMRVVLAIAPGRLPSGDRVLLALTGALAMIVGLLCLRAPLQTLLALSIILGAWWLISGIVDIVRIAAAPKAAHRGLGLAMALISSLMGGFLLVNPELSLKVMVGVLCLWLIAVGILASAEALRMRAQQRMSDPSP
ncbi:HdeD family acid-resistance protein [Nocardioides alcanivorans]|uniref:HdeD family acid-resistance protein n=1 Tax=Nocardioides alcanivorans TaxID=2897352 RepID=UPI001F20B857|nr:DUF308 domain-containing protein [Nocardioides alcanivorans]